MRCSCQQVGLYPDSVSECSCPPPKERPLRHGWTVPLLRRADDLRDAGLAYQAIARVLSLDHGFSTSGRSVSYQLQAHMGHLPDARKARGNNPR